MSLKVLFPSTIPEQTLQIVEPLLAVDSVYRLVGQQIGNMLSDQDFITMYAIEGRSGINPVVLCLVTIFQFVENVSDRAAAQMAALRLDWKYALPQELDWQGFHYSDLCNFRKRLLKHGQESQVFEKVVDYLREQGYVRARGKQRTDSTHIIGAVRDLSVLDLVQETLHVTLEALTSTDPPWTLHYLPASFVKTYAPRQRYEWTSKEDLRQALQTAARDGEWLLAHVKQFGTPALHDLPEVKLLRRVLNEQFDLNKAERTYTPTGHFRGNFIASPHDVEARHSTKRKTHWVGYRCHVTESISDKAGEARFITDVRLVPAPDADNQYVEAIQMALAYRCLLPRQHYVDQGYMSAANLADSLNRGVDLRGCLLPDTSDKPAGFRLADFQIDIAQQIAICPAGQTALRFVPSPPQPRNLVAYHVFFGKVCLTCPFFGPTLCTDKPNGRHLSLNLHHELIQEHRKEAATPTFRREMQIRVGIESVISELVRTHGLRRARYRGRAKNSLQVCFIGAAANLKRLAKASLLFVFTGTWHKDVVHLPLPITQFFNRVLFGVTTVSTKDICIH